MLGVVTKVDYIHNKQNSAWGKVLSGTNPNFTMKPKHGWHPARMITAGEYEEGCTREEFMRTQAELFAHPGWVAHAERCRMAFGWDALSGKIYSLFGEMVKELYVAPASSRGTNVPANPCCAQKSRAERCRSTSSSPPSRRK